VLVVIAIKASITLTHGVTFTIMQVSYRSMNDQSWVSHLSLEPLVSHVEHVCLDGLVVSSSSHVSVCSYDYLCIFKLLIYLVIFAEVLMTIPLTCSRAITLFYLNQLSTGTVKKHQASLFKLRCLQAIQTTLMLVTRTIRLDSHPGIDSPQNLHRGHWPHLLNWLRKLRR